MDVYIKAEQWEALIQELAGQIATELKKDGKYITIPTGTAGMKPQTHDIEAVIRQALAKYEKGRLELGQLDLSKDKRDFVNEAIDELTDCINYCVFQIIKLRGIRDVR